ncbi:Plug domain-containing protein [Nitrospirillum sp. BR 11828]|uniref:Plug domain-containing protein n=1 Tax=Nitrospirillum sp. BR 11828 TaxID=3104325 RepID=UPI002ACA2CFE|nr:Plug domain-containing protein [Nitrospirillum sp. BR 11828]MDZ5646383.1 Plug domain-containing protein [Nitrospirillum sp. BR 11828]
MVIASLAIAAPSAAAPPALAQTEITVTATPPEATRLDDRTVYDLANNLQAKGGGSVADILTTLPSVSVDPAGKVSVHGATVTVMVDGKPSPALRGMPLATALQSMPANTIAKIEVITDPGPEFRGMPASSSTWSRASRAPRRPRWTWGRASGRRGDAAAPPPVPLGWAPGRSAARPTCGTTSATICWTSIGRPRTPMDWPPAAWWSIAPPSCPTPTPPAP